jgi:hypothetical protein
MSLTWPSKHPAEVADYVWDPKLDAGDTVATASITVNDGTVTAEARGPQPGDTTLIADVSDGTDGETNVLYAIVTTVGGRTFDQTIYLPVVASASTDPNVAALKMRYPAFAVVDDATIAYWLTDAAGYVGSSWSDADRNPGLMAAAAHFMKRAGVPGIAGGDVAGFAAAGVTHFRSGSFQAQFSDEAVKAQVAGGWASTSYGQEYLLLLRRNVMSMGVTAPGVVPCCDGYNGFAGQLPPYVC